VGSQCTVTTTIINEADQPYTGHTVQSRAIDFKNRASKAAYAKYKKKSITEIKAKYEAKGIKVRVKITTIKPGWWFILYTMQDKGKGITNSESWPR